MKVHFNGAVTSTDSKVTGTLDEHSECWTAKKMQRKVIMVKLNALIKKELQIMTNSCPNKCFP